MPRRRPPPLRASADEGRPGRPAPGERSRPCRSLRWRMTGDICLDLGAPRAPQADPEARRAGRRGRASRKSRLRIAGPWRGPLMVRDARNLRTAPVAQQPPQLKAGFQNWNRQAEATVKANTLHWSPISPTQACRGPGAQWRRLYGGRARKGRSGFAVPPGLQARQRPPGRALPFVAVAGGTGREAEKSSPAWPRGEAKCLPKPAGSISLNDAPPHCRAVCKAKFQAR